MPKQWSSFNKKDISFFPGFSPLQPHFFISLINDDVLSSVARTFKKNPVMPKHAVAG
jgi:hypothetical protein